MRNVRAWVATGFVAAVLIGCGDATTSTNPGAIGASGATGSSDSQPDAPTVPKVVGLSGSRAEARISAAGLEPEFGPVNRKCAGLPGTGRIVAQNPSPGSNGAKGRVTVQPSCPPTDDLPSCELSDFALNLDADQPDFTGGSEDAVAYARITHESGGPCRLSTTFVISIEGASGVPPQVPDNPFRVSIDREIGVGMTINSDWLWSSWCGTSSKFSFVVDSLAKRQRHAIKFAPTCKGDSSTGIQGFSRVKAEPPSGDNFRVGTTSRAYIHATSG